MHLAVTGDWPDEAAPLQAFGEEAQSVTVSPQHFYLVTIIILLTVMVQDLTETEILLM